MKKRIVSICLILCMLGMLLPVSVLAAGITREQAVQWATSCANTGWEINDGSGYTQCTEFVWAYYEYLIGYHVSGDARDYLGDTYGACPYGLGWTRPSVGSAQAGDIVIWDGAPGHIGVILSRNGDTLTTAEANAEKTNEYSNLNPPTGACAMYDNRPLSGVSGLIRPAFASSQPVQQTAPTVNVTVNGSTVDVAWNDVGAASYYLYVQNQDTQNIPYGENLGKSLSCHLELASGNYKVYVSAVYTESNILTGSAAFSILPKTAPAVNAMVNGNTVDVAWNDVGAASYYLYVQNQDTQNIPYGENLGKSLSCHLELASGNYKVYVSAVYTESNILTGSAAFSILLERSAPTVSAVVNGKTVDISWNDVGAVSYELHVFSLDSGDVAFSQDMGRTFSRRLELSAGQWQVNVTALYEGFDNGLAGSCVCTVTSGGAGPTVIASGACGDNLTWTLDEQGALTISGTGPMWDWNRGNEALWYEYRASIKTAVIQSGVTNIGKFAFEGCNSLVSVTIPDGITSIGAFAFEYCGLTDVTLPGSATTIGNYAFYGCDNLTSLTVPECVTDIGNYAFSWCTNLATVLLPSSVTNIGDYAFSYCYYLASITMPEGVTSMGDSVFEGCGTLTSVTIPLGITSIGKNAFHYCTSLASVALPVSVVSVDNGAFSFCDKLADVYYGGTQEQWDGIAIAINNEPLLNATLHVQPGGDSPAIALTARYLYDRIVPSEPSIHNEPICEDGTVVFSYVGDVGMDVPPEIDGYQYRYKTVGNAHGAHLEARLTDAGETAYYIVEYNGQATPVTGDTVVTYHYYIPNPQPSLPVAYYHDEDGNELLPPQTLTLDENGQVWFTEMVGDYEAFRLLAPEIDGYTIKAVHVRGEYGGSGSALPTLGCFLGPWDDYDGQWLLGQQGTESGSVSGTPMCTYVYERNTAGSVEEPGVIASGFCGAQGDNLVWTLSEDGTLTISGTGAMADYYTQQDQHFAQGDYEYGQTAPVEELYADNPPWYFSERFITGIVIEDGVTSVGRHAFQCTAFQRLNSVTIPASMTSIGDFAFCVCYNLADVYYAGAQGQWDAITVGEHNEPLLSATLHLESTGPMIIASGNCGAQGDNVTWTLDEAGTLTISGTGDMADFLDSWDPWYNKGVKAAVIKSGVTSIGGGAFAYCSSLTSVTIPNTVTSIGLDAFSNCSSLTSVTIPESVTSIGSSAFIFSSKLGAIHVAETNPSYRSLDGVLYTADGKKLCSVPGAKMGIFVIPDTVTSIGERAFQTCGSLTRITIPDTVTSIGDWAFGYCTALTSLTIPANVTSIGYATFANCRGLTSVTIPESMTSIGDAAFFNCDSLADVYYGGTQAQWDAVTVGEFNEPLENATLHLESTGPGFVEAETVTYVWGEDGNATVYDEQGNLLTNTWIRMEIPLQGPDGGEFIDIIWRYTDENGRFVEGWQEIDGYTYYFLGSITYRSLRDQACGIDRAFYFFDEEGRMRRDGWAQSSGSEKVYYAGADGKLLQGWQTIDGKQYYFSAAEGYAPYRWQNGVYTIDGEDYRFAEDGSLIGKVQNDQPGFRIGSVVGHAGKTVTVSVSLENNPGIALFKVYVEYDESVLEWTGIEHIALDGFWSAEVNKPIVWMGDGETEYDGNGEIFTLTFTVKDDAQPCETAVSLRYDPDDIQTWNESIFNYDNVAFAVLDGTVTVRSTVTVTGTVTGWNGSADAEVYLYAADTEDTVLNAAAQSGDYSGAIVSATLSGVTVYGKRYICAFTLADVEPGTYKLLVMKPGKYVPVIRTVTLEDDADLGKVKLWLYGDVTDDGKVNGTDALQIKRYFADISSIFMVGTEEEQAARLLAANVTAILSGDNKVNGTDALQIQRYFADISSVFEYMR